MEPISTVIVAAITAGLTEVGKETVVDMYKGLKTLIGRKFGPQSKVTEAISSLEASPNAKGRQLKVEQELAAVKADQDPELRRAAEALLDLLKGQPGGLEHVQQVAVQMGSHNTDVQIVGSDNQVGSFDTRRRKDQV